MKKITIFKTSLFLFCSCLTLNLTVSQEHPRIYTNNSAKTVLQKRIATQENVGEFIEDIHSNVDAYVDRHGTDPEWIISRLQMYWKTKYKEVYVKGMDFSHGAGSAPVPTVRFSGSRDWDTDYIVPSLENIKPYMDDERGLYLQNDKKPNKPWEWVHPSETGHVVENINYKILHLAEEAAFLYWLEGKEKYAVFATDILMKYIEGMHYRDAPLTVHGHHNKDLMGLQTFEVIHEKVVVPLVIGYDYLFDYLKKGEKDIAMIQSVFKKWADQEIKYGVPGNNWNLMQARYITYLALALENDKNYPDGKGQQYYIDQVLNQNSRKQKALKDVIKNFDPETGIWPEVASYSIMVSDDILEVYCLIDKSLSNNLLEEYPMLEKAILANFNYLFVNGYTTAYGDAKHSRLRFSALELLISQYRKYDKPEKENLITGQLKRFIEDGAYDREQIRSLFQMFYYVEDLKDVPAANSFSAMVNPTFYSPNVSWTVQRNGNSEDNGMMISKNASLGNHSHANGVNIELFAKGMVIATDCARGDSYWSTNHREYYSRFPAHNTVIVDGISDYKTMNSTHAFSLKSLYPAISNSNDLFGDYTFSDVLFIEPASDATQQRLTGTIRTSETSGYFIDIFRSARKDMKDKKHEYLFHGQGEGILLSNYNNTPLSTLPTEELSSKRGDLIGYDYFTNKREIVHSVHFIAQFSMPSFYSENLKVKLYMKGYEDRKIFTVDAPYSRADSKKGIPEILYQKPIPTLIVRQSGEAQSKPFVSIIDVFNEEETMKVLNVGYFDANDNDSNFIGVKVTSTNGRKDYIYNDQNSDKEHVFKSGSFKGSYGVTSFYNEELTSLILGYGSLLKTHLWSISALTDEGGVLIKINKNELIVDAEKPFRMTIPADYLNENSTFEAVDTAGNRTKYIGEIRTLNDTKIIVFEFPKMNKVILKKGH